MKENTKAKLAKAGVAIKKAVRAFWEWVPIFAAETVVILGIDAYITSRKNERGIKKITEKFNENVEIQNDNWKHLEAEQRVVFGMIKDNKELLDKALGVTSGEEPEEEKKEEEPAA